MVTPDGQSTMLGQWRVALKQAEDAAQAGRIDEALALASRPDVADSRPMVRLRDRLGLDLVARSGRRAEADDLAGAIDDLGRAEGLNVAPDLLAKARLALADSGRRGDPRRPRRGRPEPGRRADRRPGPAQDQQPGAPAEPRAGRSLARRARRGPPRRVRPGLDGLDRADRLAGDRRRRARSPPAATWKPGARPPQPAVDRLYAALGAGKVGRDPGRRRGRDRGRPRASRRPPGPGPGLAADRGHPARIGHLPDADQRADRRCWTSESNRRRGPRVPSPPPARAPPLATSAGAAPADRRADGPVPALGRCRRRLPGLPGRLGGPRPGRGRVRGRRRGPGRPVAAACAGPPRRRRLGLPGPGGAGDVRQRQGGDRSSRWSMAT